MIQALVFDLDDTLYLESDFVASGYRAVARHLARRYQCCYGEIFYAMMNAFVNLGRRMVFPLVVERFLPHDFPLEELVEVYRQHMPRIGLFPGYRELLQRLGRDFRLGIVTDGLPEVQKRKVRALRLNSVVQNIIYTWEFGPEKEKPHPFAFNLMLDHLGTEPGSALFVGDNPEKDCAGAHSVGMRYAQVCLPPWKKKDYKHEGDAEFVIHSLYQLPYLLQLKV